MNTINLFFRSLKRKKTLTVITIGGYAISMAVLLILVTFIIGEKSVNKGFENGDRIYRFIRSDNESPVPKTLLDDVKEKVPGVEKMCLYAIQQKLYKIGTHQEWARFIATNDDYLDMFSFNFIYGSFDPTLSVKTNIILTKSFSEKLFGERNPVGESLEIDKNKYSIVGVVNDVPKNSSFQFDAFINVDLAFVSKYVYMGEKEHTLVNSFVMLSPNFDPETVNSQISGMISHWKAYKDIKLSLQPLTKVYFNGLANDQLLHANVNMIYLLSSIALIILLMTVFNYVNLTISRSSERLNEFGIKKTTGAEKKDIFRQVLTESLLISCLAIIIAVLAISFISPLFTDILDKRIEISTILSQPLILIIAIVIFLATGILSGIYPALRFSGVSPLQMMGHQKSLKRRNQRAGIIAVQFFITSVLIIALLFIQKQLDFVKHQDPGFDKEMLVRFDLKGNAAQKWEVLREGLLKYPQIVSVSASLGTPLQIMGSSSGKYDVAGEKKEIVIYSISVDENFVRTFGLNLVRGRNIQDADSNVCLINEHLYNEFEWDDLTGKKVGNDRLVGVVKDFHYQNLYTEIGNLKLQQLPLQHASVLNVRINGNISENLEIIKNEYKKFEPEMPFDFRFYDDWLQSMYQKEEKQAKAIRVFALFAIVISCLGLVGLIENITNKKVKEIGIRKINGAKINEIIVMLNKTVVQWVVSGFVISCPVAYYAMNKWLENFAYKTTLSWWIFALAGMLALGIALLTVSWQSWRAASKNPVEALRYE